MHSTNLQHDHDEDDRGVFFFYFNFSLLKPFFRAFLRIVHSRTLNGAEKTIENSFHRPTARNLQGAHTYNPQREPYAQDFFEISPSSVAVMHICVILKF